ncbi:MAG: hypothetical protein AAFX02_01530, partial [Pseudomonadota bacterium]
DTSWTLGEAMIKECWNTLKEQEWVTIIIESLMIVLGVLVALQVSNWNDIRKARKDAFEILDRLESEVNANISAVRTNKDKIGLGRESRNATGQILETCDATQGNIESVAQSIDLLTTDIIPAFVDDTARELGRSNQYFEYLTPDFRNAFDAYMVRLADEEEQLKINFGLMWDNHVFKHPAVSFKFGETVLQSEYALDATITELCNDAEFKRSFGLTAIFHESTDLRLDRFINEANVFLDALAKEQKRKS